MEPQNIYWLFSSSAQVISVFIAFLLTGFAFVHTMMDSLQDKDNVLNELHYKLMRTYYSRIKWLSTLTGLAIVLSLLMLYLNGISVPSDTLIILTSVINLIAICFGILFVISIINPDKYQKPAREILQMKEEVYKTEGKEDYVDKEEFRYHFINLETILRALVIRRNLYSPKIGPQFNATHALIIGEMINVLWSAKLINDSLCNELREITEYHLMVFFAGDNRVNKDIVDRTKSAIKELEKILDQNSPVSEFIS